MLSGCVWLEADRRRDGGGFIRVHIPSGCNQRRGKAGDGAVSLTLTMFFHTDVLAGFHIF
jgi:hypothetical protein